VWASELSFMNSNKGILILAAVGAVAAAQTASAQTLNSTSIVGYADNATGGLIDSLQYAGSTDSTPAYAALTNLQLSGLDSSGAPQTMTFTGWTNSVSDYGSLHNSTYASVTNSFYNANNPSYDPTTGTGTPYSEDSLGFSQFTDTLQFGGLLSAGYKASYVFHIDGTVTGNMTENQGGDLGVNLAGTNFGYFAFGNGNYDTVWGTGQVAVNGTYAQTVTATLSSQAYVDNSWYPDGSNISGEADFADTSTLLGVVLYNPQGQIVTSGVTVTSASGTQYALLAAPEPSGWAALGVGMLGLLRLRRKR